MTDSRNGVVARYENIVLNEDFGPITEKVDDYKVKKFAFTMDDYHPWYFGESPFGQRIGHAGILANDLLQLYTQVYDANTAVGLHTHEELWFVNPVRVPEQVTLYGKYVEKYEHRGKGYVVMEADAQGEDGRILLRHRGVEILHIEPGPVVGKSTVEARERRVTGEYRKDIEPVSHARVGLAPGTPLVPLHKQPLQDQIAVFSLVGKHVRNVHTDIEVARRAGLKDTLAQGMMESIYLTELLTSFFGPTWFTTGWQKVKFIRPVYCGDRLTARGVVTGDRRESRRTRLEVDIWVENSAGEMTAAGGASGRLAE
ncbi:MAG TPA: MaoC/PaaZ C-terminal domain-containing protein [Candidatus Methylomirabilis sp.]|nr:MaoC/PaaZ C-terminal domain-containing protein [Candidatus Methylomirabilis sp.]